MRYATLVSLALVLGIGIAISFLCAGCGTVRIAVEDGPKHQLVQAMYQIDQVRGVDFPDADCIWPDTTFIRGEVHWTPCEFASYYGYLISEVQRATAHNWSVRRYWWWLPWNWWMGGRP
jgi:hypothetical protein